MALSLHNYQKDAIKFLLRHPYAGIFADPGLGKTVIILIYIQILKRMYPNIKFLIIAPLRVIYSVWPEENKKWGFNFSIRNLHSEEYKKATIYLINPESLSKVPHWNFEGLVVDESTKFKNPSSKRFKYLKKYIPNFYYRIILTGTPTPNSLLDLFSQMYIIDKGKTLGRFITHYRNDYFYRTGYMGYVWEPFNNSQEIIEKKISRKIMRIDATTYLDLPDLIVNDIYIDLPKDVQKLYKGVEKYLFYQIENAKVALTNKASGYNACKQIANGGLYEQIDPDLPIPIRRKVYGLHDAKVEALTDLIEELHGKPTFIAYQFRHDLKRIKKAIPSAKEIPKDPTKIIRDWNAGKIPILLGHPASVGHGLNLQYGGNDIIWFSLTDNLENYIQFNRRIYRQGISNRVRIHRIIARDTVDEALIRLLDKKERRQSALLNALMEYRNGKTRN